MIIPSQKSTATYIKLQDAYVSERNEVGTWKQVGYVAPGATKAGEQGATTNFTYSEGEVEGSLAQSTDEIGKTWGASNNVALNDCLAQTAHAVTTDHWVITLSNTSNGNSITYAATIPGGADCSQLTPSFELIGK